MPPLGVMPYILLAQAAPVGRPDGAAVNQKVAAEKDKKAADNSEGTDGVYVAAPTTVSNTPDYDQIQDILKTLQDAKQKIANRVRTAIEKNNKEMAESEKIELQKKIAQLQGTIARYKAKMDRLWPTMTPAARAKHNAQLDEIKKKADALSSAVSDNNYAETAPQALKELEAALGEEKTDVDDGDLNRIMFGPNWDKPGAQIDKGLRWEWFSPEMKRRIGRVKKEFVFMSGQGVDPNAANGGQKKAARVFDQLFKMALEDRLNLDTMNGVLTANGLPAMTEECYDRFMLEREHHWYDSNENVSDVKNLCIGLENIFISIQVNNKENGVPRTIEDYEGALEGEAMAASRNYKAGFIGIAKETNFFPINKQFYGAMLVEGLRNENIRMRSAEARENGGRELTDQQKQEIEKKARDMSLDELLQWASFQDNEMGRIFEKVVQSELMTPEEKLKLATILIIGQLRSPAYLVPPQGVLTRNQESWVAEKFETLITLVEKKGAQSPQYTAFSQQLFSSMWDETGMFSYANIEAGIKDESIDVPPMVFARAAEAAPPKPPPAGSQLALPIAAKENK